MALHRPLAQRMMRYLGRCDPQTSGGRVALDLWRFARLILLRYKDPLVSYRFEGQSIRVPFSHDLPVIRQQFPQYMTALTRLAHQVATKYPNARAVDVGANVGDTIVAIRAGSSMPILAVEGSAAYFQLLHENVQTFSAVELEGSFVSHQGDELLGGLRVEHGTAHFVPGTDRGAPVQKTLSQIIDAHPQFRETRLLKLDTDGFDCAILMSSLDWLANAMPVVYFEYDPAAFGRYAQPGFKVFQALRSIGYSSALVWDNRGDFLLSCDLSDQELVEELHAYFSGRAGKVYCDIAMFHTNDADLRRSVRAGELTFFAAVRGQTDDQRDRPGGFA